MGFRAPTKDPFSAGVCGGLAFLPSQCALLRLFHGRLGQGERPLSFGDWEPLPVVYRTIRSMEPSVWCSFLADRKHMQPSGLAMVVRAERKGDEKGHERSAFSTGRVSRM